MGQNWDETGTEWEYDSTIVKQKIRKINKNNI